MTGSMPLTRGEQPLISVILPTCNRAGTLRRAIDSVLSQTYPRFELIVVDDASSDDSPAIVADCADPKLRFLHLERHSGASAARNVGILASSGEWIAFQDSDDAWLPEKLEKQVEVLRDSRAGVIYSSFRWARGSHSGVSPSRLQQVLGRLPLCRTRLDGDLSVSLRRGNFISTQTAMVKRETLERGGLFDPRLPRFQDWDLWLRLAPLCPFRFIQDPLVVVNLTPHSISTDHAALQQALGIMREKWVQPEGAEHELEAHLLFASGDLACFDGDYGQGQASLWQAVKLCPENLTYGLFALRSLFGREFYRWSAQHLRSGYAGSF